jgi:hypothetical protein
MLAKNKRSSLFIRHDIDVEKFGLKSSTAALMRIRMVKKNSDKPKLSKLAKATMAELLRLRMVKKSPKKSDAKATAGSNPSQLLRLRMVKKSKDLEDVRKMFKLFRILPI